MKKIISIKRNMMLYFQRKHISLKKILEGSFEKSKIKIRYLGDMILNEVPEYDFHLLKFNVLFEDYSNINLYIRLIDKNKIDENLFCYWLFCEKYLPTKTSTEMKTSIINCDSKKYESKYKLQFINGNKKLNKFSIVNIINLNKYCKIKDYTIYNVKFNKLLFIAF